MAESWEAEDAFLDEQMLRLVECKDAWEAQVREGSDDARTLLWVAEEMVLAQRDIRELRAVIAARAEQEGD